MKYVHWIVGIYLATIAGNSVSFLQLFMFLSWKDRYPDWLLLTSTLLLAALGGIIFVLVANLICPSKDKSKIIYITIIGGLIAGCRFIPGMLKIGGDNLFQTSLYLLSVVFGGLATAVYLFQRCEIQSKNGKYT
ncbi:MAG: hypothetical protein GY951_00900 [Psychromonas sp.]|nr:hypothetical protein [Psychromonas sp.]